MVVLTTLVSPLANTWLSYLDYVSTFEAIEANVFHPQTCISTLIRTPAGIRIVLHEFLRSRNHDRTGLLGHDTNLQSSMLPVTLLSFYQVHFPCTFQMPVTAIGYAATF